MKPKAPPAPKHERLAEELEAATAALAKASEDLIIAQARFYKAQSELDAALYGKPQPLRLDYPKQPAIAVAPRKAGAKKKKK